MITGHPTGRVAADLSGGARRRLCGARAGVTQLRLLMSAIGPIAATGTETCSVGEHTDYRARPGTVAAIEEHLGGWVVPGPARRLAGGPGRVGAYIWMASNAVTA